MAVSKKAKAIYTGFWEKTELFVANRISDYQESKKLKKYLDHSFELSKSEKREIEAFWKPYGGVSTDWCRYYYSKNDIFDPRYIPNTLYYTRIDQHFNSRKLGYGFNDKNYYSLLFADVKQPHTLVRKIGGLLFDVEYRLIKIDKAIEILQSVNEVIVKPTQESGSGRGIAFYDTVTEIEGLKAFLCNNNEKDYIVQAVVKQHEYLASIYPKAINTIRVTTLLLEDGVHVLSSVLRMGIGESRVDNASNGGISVGIDENGMLKKYGHILYQGNVVDKHPDGFVFQGFKVPEYGNIVRTVKKLAQYTGNFRLVSWDLTVDCNENVVLIEANMRKGGIAIHQFNNGPLFGDLTERVLDEVFGKR